MTNENNNMKKKPDVVDTGIEKKPRLLGVDCGTMNLVIAEQNEQKEIELSSMRNMYLPLEKSQLTMVEMSNISHVENEDQIFIVGEDAYRFGNMFGQEVKRPMSKGLISASNSDSIDILALILKQLVGTTYSGGGHIVYSVPAPSIDTENNILYHEGVFKRIFTQLGFTSESFNESMAIIYSQCQDNKFTGLAFSFGAGMVNCISGETKIRLLNGQIKTIKELSELYPNGENFWIYSCKEDGTLVPGKAHHPRKMKTSTKIIKITLDDESVEECTPDHLWMMRNGMYKEAKDLKENDSLMPLRLRISDKHSAIAGYQMYYDNVTRGWKFTHRMVSESIQPVPFNNVIHHWNFNKLDNSPENLIIMTKEDHIALHGVCANNSIERMLGKTFDEIYGIEKSKIIRQKMSDSMKLHWEQNPDDFINFVIGGRLWSELILGKTFEEIYGIEVSKEIRNNMSLARKGKTFEEIYGEELSKKIKEQKSEYVKKQILNGTFGTYERTDIWKKEMEYTFFHKGQAPWNKGLDSVEYKSHFDTDKVRSNSIKQWNNSEKRKHLMRSKGMVVAKHLIQNNIEINKVNYENQRCQMIKKDYGPISYDSWLKYFDSEEQLKESSLNWNHKVKKIEIIEKECDVYDLTVDEFHNFALASGVFVHNCALSFKSVPIISFSVARSGDWIDEQAALSTGTIPNRITSIKEKGTDLMNFNVGSKKERRLREAITYYYREVIRYSLEKVKNKLEESTGNIELPESLPIIVSGGTSLAKGFIELFKEVISEYKEFPIQISEIKHADDPLNCVAEGLLIKGMMKNKIPIEKK